MWFCECKDCKKMRRKGKVLGTRMMGYWLTRGIIGEPEYYYGPVSGYVDHPKFAKGRARKEKWPDTYDE